MIVNITAKYKANFRSQEIYTFELKIFKAKVKETGPF